MYDDLVRRLCFGMLECPRISFIYRIPWYLVLVIWYYLVLLYLVLLYRW